MKLFFKLNILPYIVFIFHRLLSWTWRVETILCEEIRENLANNKSMIFAHWHKDETVLVLSIRQLRGGILNSMSSDGQMMAKIVRMYGAKTAKGSSSRGGVEALKGLVRLTLKDGRNPAVAVDGPRGPYKNIKPGVFQLSRLTQANIYPAAVHFSSAWFFPRAWDKAYLPKPFSRVLIYWGEPMTKVLKRSDPKSPELSQQLTQAFDIAEKKAGLKFSKPLQH